MKAIWEFLSHMHREAECGGWVNECMSRDLRSWKQTQSHIPRGLKPLNCTLQRRQKLKEVNSFSAQYGAAIYRARYQQQHNRTHVSCLLHSLQRKQFLCQTARSALTCSIWKTCFPHDLQLLICSGAESAVCITQNAHNNQLWHKIEKYDTTHLLNLLHLENLLPTWLAVAHLFRGTICSLLNTKCTQ